jgi:hypothetical protein
MPAIIACLASDTSWSRRTSVVGLGSFELSPSVGVFRADTSAAARKNPDQRQDIESHRRREGVRVVDWRVSQFWDRMASLHELVDDHADRDRRRSRCDRGGDCRGCR